MSSGGFRTKITCCCLISRPSLCPDMLKESRVLESSLHLNTITTDELNDPQCSVKELWPVKVTQQQKNNSWRSEEERNLDYRLYDYESTLLWFFHKWYSEVLSCPLTVSLVVIWKLPRLHCPTGRHRCRVPTLHHAAEGCYHPPPPGDQRSKQNLIIICC